VVQSCVLVLCRLFVHAGYVYSRVPSPSAPLSGIQYLTVSREQWLSKHGRLSDLYQRAIVLYPMSGPELARAQACKTVLL
jgi:hypothetical protein